MIITRISREAFNAGDWDQVKDIEFFPDDQDHPDPLKALAILITETLSNGDMKAK